MLNETIFLIGGAICLAAGVLFLTSLALFGALAVDPFLGVPGTLFLVMAVLFLYTGWSARRDRRTLLREGQEGTMR